MSELKRMFAKECLRLDYFIYSSHKTGTQSLVSTLRYNGFKSLHCHLLKNIGLENGEFRAYLKDYFLKNKKKLNVITVFRDPMERHISSFFQWYGTRPLLLKQVENKSETIIYRYTIEELQEKFLSELSAKSLIGYRESIHEICKELHISTRDLTTYREEQQFSIYETEYMKLYLIRFDVLVQNFENILSEITKTSIRSKLTNLSASKWYKDIYSQFKESLMAPDNIIREVYNSKRDIINLLYSAGFDSILNQAFIKYGKEQKQVGLQCENE